MVSRRLSRIAVWLVLSFGFTTISTRAQSIEPLPAGFYPRAASADGSVVVGYVVTGSNEALAAYWTAADGVQTISDPSLGAFETYANDVSADGTIIVGATRFDTDKSAVSQRGWMWTEEAGLVHLPAPSLGDEELYVYWATAIGVEEGKVTIVGTANDHAVRWVNGGTPQVLGDFNPYDVSQDGSVIVGDGYDHNMQKVALKWVNGVVGVIQDASDERLAVSGDGMYIAGHDRPSSSPARWAVKFGDNEVLTDEWWGTALSLSGDGSVLVGQAYKAFESGPFIWTEQGGFRMLRDLLENDYGTDLTAWPLFDSINRVFVTDGGNVVIGEGSSAMPALMITLCGTAIAWENALGGIFDDSTNWAGNIIPDSLLTALFATGGGTYTISFDGNASVNRIETSEGEDVSLALGGHTITLTASCNAPSAILDGAYVDIENGTVDAVDAVVLSGNEPVLHIDAQARLVVDSDESGLDCLVADGEDGEALMSVADGGVVESLSCSEFGKSASTAGRLVVDGGGRFVTSTLTVGGSGAGAVEVPQGFVEARRLIMADDGGSSSAVTVEQAGVLHFKEDADVGVRGKADLRLSDAGIAVGGDPDASAVSLLVLGRELSGQGQLILEGDSYFAGSDAVVGQEGLGNIQVKSGSLAEIRRLWVGGHLEGTQGVGGVYVDGSGSRLVARRMWVGRSGFGVVEVTNGGLLQADRIEAYGSSGSLTEESGGVIKAPVIWVGGGNPAGKRGMEDLEGIVTDTLALMGAGATIAAGTVAFGSESTVEAELGTPGEALVVMDGAAQLGGRLRVSVAEGYTPNVGDRHVVLKAASVEGAFDAVIRPEDLALTMEYTDTAAVAVVTSVSVNREDERPEVPSEYALHAVYPNPFNPSAIVEYELPEAQEVELVVYDVHGRLVRELARGMRPAGRHAVVLEGGDLPSGIYFYRLRTGAFEAVRSALLIK